MSGHDAEPEYVIRDCLFGKANQIEISDETKKDFIQNYILADASRAPLFSHFSTIYFLVARKSSDKSTNKNEKKWKDILDTENYDKLKILKQIVVAYCLISPHKTKKGDKTIHFTLVIDNRDKKYNFAEYLISRYEKDILHYDGMLIPAKIYKSSENFWKKYFAKNFDEAEIKNINELINNYDTESDEDE